MTTATKHTPGPWEWNEDTFHGGLSGLSGPDGVEVLFPEHCNDGDDGAAWFDSTPSEADKLLIEEAPALLKELDTMCDAAQDVIDYWESGDQAAILGWAAIVGRLQVRLFAARAAIAKATGEQP